MLSETHRVCVSLRNFWLSFIDYSLHFSLKAGIPIDILVLYEIIYADALLTHSSYHPPFEREQYLQPIRQGENGRKTRHKYSTNVGWPDMERVRIGKVDSSFWKWVGSFL